jgi:hypothetical protein
MRELGKGKVVLDAQPYLPEEHFKNKAVSIAGRELRL